jgi:heparan-alpha-glucosaminide N-acetyltransferase
MYQVAGKFCFMKQIFIFFLRRGSLKDYCNAAGYVDYHILTVNHMYPEPTCLQSTPPCPYFDPEGILSTFFATVSPLIGLYFGYMLIHYTSHKDRLFQWIPPAIAFIILSLPLHFTGFIPYNKNLYSLSYVLLTSGLAAVTFSLFYFIIDVKGIRKPFVPFIWLGMVRIQLLN